MAIAEVNNYSIRNGFYVCISKQKRMKYCILIFVLLLSFLKGFSQESQNDIIANYSSGLYTVYKSDDKNKFEKVSKNWPIEISSNGGLVNKILVKRSGILDEIFIPDVIGYPSYFLFKNFRLTFLKEYIVYYEWNAKQEATAKFIFVKEGHKFNEEYGTVNLTVQKYVAATFKNQSTAKSTQKEELARLTEQDRKINSLEGKEVKTIALKIIQQPDQVGHFGKAIHYGIIATLKDGTELKTTNLGGKLPWDDFELNHEGCSNIAEITNVENDASKIPNDEVVLNITSIHHKQLKASHSIVTTNDIPIQVYRNGYRGLDRGKTEVTFQGVDGQHAGNGETLTIKVVAAKHKKTGGAINKIEVYSESQKQIVGKYKLTPGTALIVNVKGGQGMDGRKGWENSKMGGKGGNGGNGGTVTVIKDPSVQEFNITINNEGGNAGRGGPPAQSYNSKGPDGHQGSQGSLHNQTQKVSLNF